MLCQWAGTQENRGDHSQNSWTEQAKAIFHTTEHHTQDINWGKLVRATYCCSGKAGHWSATGEQLYCASLVSLEFYFSVSPFLLLLLLILYFILFQLLNCSYLKPQVCGIFSIILLTGEGAGRNWVSSYLVLSCWLGSNHNNREQQAPSEGRVVLAGAKGYLAAQSNCRLPTDLPIFLYCKHSGPGSLRRCWDTWVHQSARQCPALGT